MRHGINDSLPRPGRARASWRARPTTMAVGATRKVPDFILTPMFRRAAGRGFSWSAVARGSGPAARHGTTAPAARKGPDAVRLRAGPSRRRARAREAFRRRAEGRQPAHLDAPDRGAAAPPRIALRQGQRRVHGGPVPLVGLRPPSRSSRCSSRRRRRACWSWWRRRSFTASLTEPPLPEDATSGQTAEQLPTYNAYSIDGDVTGELVYVNYGVPSRLRGARAPRHRRQGQDRHRPLRRLVARHQAEGRRRARRDRLPDLLRPARRRLLPGRRLSQGRLAQRARARSAARWPTCRSTPAIR